ncbi:EGF-like and EMI domain-containing protein 1, partial [Stegodyphus dumicola]|uniref:EGF-like and EMI domain-containing protein 1 n=1 Tax=Stegodyphus dumicola TaxID=202533 RepID=UPI0015B21D5A
MFVTVFQDINIWMFSIVLFLSSLIHFIDCSSLEPHMPHVCTERQMESVKVQKPCTRAYTQMTKVWKPNCGHHSWCVTYEPRTVYYSGFTESYETQYNTVSKCCKGWTQKNDEPGCFY